MTTPAPLSQDELKTLVGQAALQYVVQGEVVGVGTGSTVNKFIDALASMKDQVRGAVSSSVASTERLRALGIPVLDANEVRSLSVYIDGADEIDGRGYMVMGGFPLPVEVIPMATAQIARRFESLGGEATLRLKDGQPLVTDNGQHILDVRGLTVSDPLAFESEVNQWPGVVTVGVFAHQKASVCLLGTAQGVKTLSF
jgi:ribose 5-phosphate isomerase A